MVGAARGEALAAIGEGERTQRGTVLGAIGRHRDLQTKEIAFLRISCQGQDAEFSQEARDTFEQGNYTRIVIGLLR
jgi:hypothetical protein